MTIIRSTTVFCLVAFASVGFSAGQPEFATGSILIKTTSNFQPAIVDTTFGAPISRDLGVKGWRRVNIPRGATLATAANYYKKAPGVLLVEPNYIVRPTFVPNDPDLSKQYWVNITRAPQAWDVFRGAASFVVAVIDTGVDYNHPDLSAKCISKGKDFVNGDDDAMDDDSHGTHVAGLVAAGTNNAIGGVGMGFNIRILPVKVLGPGGGTLDGVIEGMRYAADSSAKVLNMSLGGYGTSQAVQDACDYVLSRGKLTIAAAGNDNLDAAISPMFPANCANVFSVAASTSTDTRAGFSNYGDLEIDVVAPGEGIYSTIPGSGYAVFDGTSMASPIVAGLAGLVWSYAPTATPKQIQDAIMKTSDRIGNFVISGRINAFKAIQTFTAVTPISASLVSKQAFQGTPVTGPGAVMNIRSLAAQGVGQIAAMKAVLKMPNMPIASLQKASTTVTFGAHSTGTAQLFVWNRSTRKYDLLVSTPGSAGKLAWDVTTFPAQYYDPATRNYELIVRMLVPSRSGVSAGSFVFPIHTLSGQFYYRTNP